jgi:hypothetical protein
MRGEEDKERMRERERGQGRRSDLYLVIMLPDINVSHICTYPFHALVQM